MYAKFCELNDILYDIYPVIGRHRAYRAYYPSRMAAKQTTFSNKNSIWF